MHLIRDCHVVSSSGCHRYPYWNEQFLFDGRRDTGWCTPSRSEAETEFIEIDLGCQRSVQGMRMLSRAINKDAGFPGTIKILKPSSDGWELVHQIDDIENDIDNWHSWELPVFQAAQLRLEFDNVGVRPEGKYFLQFMCLELYSPSEVHS